MCQTHTHTHTRARGRTNSSVHPQQRDSLGSEWRVVCPTLLEMSESLVRGAGERGGGGRSGRVGVSRQLPQSLAQFRHSCHSKRAGGDTVNFNQLPADTCWEAGGRHMTVHLYLGQLSLRCTVRHVPPPFLISLQDVAPEGVTRVNARFLSFRNDVRVKWVFRGSTSATGVPLKLARAARGVSPLIHEFGLDMVAL